ncbi:hypothetical protein K1W69_00175 [Hoeflea sp. WL0058]|uniref:DUF4382 domain-containing protein n=1 Tax=Flavimaribacter sediminis TaxID=2865987 RepID=A0AAE3CXY1_9HYPH|nr:hypothetical protein [Flavimaribacter sediminis]MBW8635585.1 hypothetical protein [Flavimaribacter sediminis]
MKQWLKNLAIAGATAGAVVLGAASASAVSFTVVIDKIELMPNGNSTDRFVIYNPAAGIGASATSTLDLLNANKTGATLPVTAPKSGTYNTMLVTFSEISVGARTASVSATQSLLASLGTTQGFGREQGRNVLIMGDPGTGAASISADLNNGVAFATVPVMQPVVSNGATVSLPAFDFFLPASKVVTSGSGIINVTSVPVPLAVARTDVDSASVPNVTIGVKDIAFKSVPTASGPFAAKVGLFRSALDMKPIYVGTATLVSNTSVTSKTITEVTFLDVADGTYLPLAWIDSDNDGLLDSGESAIMVDSTNTLFSNTQNTLTINKETLFGSGTAGTVSATSAAFTGSTTGLGSTFGASANGFLGESETSYLFPAREISVTLAATPAASVTLANDADDCAANCGLTVTIGGGVAGVNPATAIAAVSLTVGSVALPSISLVIDDDNTSTAGGNTINAADIGKLAVTTNAETVISNNALMTYSNDGNGVGIIKISPVPLATITTIDRTAAYGTYSLDVEIQANDPEGTALGAVDTTTLSSTDVALASGGHTLATNTVLIAKTLTADLGN